MSAPTEAPWGPGKPPFIIAEIGLTHEGSLGNALAFIDACADVGASAVKFQCHDGDCNSQWREGVYSHQDSNSRQLYWERTRFKWIDWQRITLHAWQKKILVGCTPFSFAALALMIELDIAFIKIARQFFDSDLHHQAKHRANPPAPILHTGPGGLGLNEYDPDRHIGISDHSATISPSVDAFKRGAQVCEVHVCWDRRQFGPDVQYSVTIDELAELVRAVK